MPRGGKYVTVAAGEPGAKMRRSLHIFWAALPRQPQVLERKRAERGSPKNTR